MVITQIPARAAPASGAAPGVNSVPGDIRIVGTNGITASAIGNTIAVKNTLELAEGQLALGRDGLSPVAASMEGAVNQVNVSTDGGTIRIFLPQDIASESKPTFAGMTLKSLGNGVGPSVIRKANGDLANLTSSRDTKENIRAMGKEISPEVLYALEPVAYNYKGQDPNEDVSFGFVAEEVDSVCQSFVIYQDGTPYSLQYSEFIPLIVMAMKVQRAEIREAQSGVLRGLSALAVLRSDAPEASQYLCEAKTAILNLASGQKTFESKLTAIAEMQAGHSHRLGLEIQKLESDLLLACVQQARNEKYAIWFIVLWFITLGVSTWAGVTG